MKLAIPLSHTPIDVWTRINNQINGIRLRIFHDPKNEPPRGKSANTFLTGSQQTSFSGKQMRVSLIRCKSRLFKCSTSISRTDKGINKAFDTVLFLPSATTNQIRGPAKRLPYTYI